MKDSAAQFSHRPIYPQSRVRIVAGPGSLIPLPEPDAAVGIPIAVADPAAKIECTARKTISRAIVTASEQTFDLKAKSVRHFFVRIQPQQPGPRSFLRCGIFLGNETFPRFAENLGPERRRDLLGAILNILVEDDDDFAGPAGDAGQSPRNPARLSAGDQDDRNGEIPYRSC